VYFLSCQVPETLRSKLAHSPAQAIIRLNQAPTDGYEAVVGGRATYRVINKEWVKKYTEGQLKWLPLEEGVSLVSRGDPEVNQIDRHAPSTLLHNHHHHTL
jgi:hypothetical protein